MSLLNNAMNAAQANATTASLNVTNAIGQVVNNGTTLVQRTGSNTFKSLGQIGQAVMAKPRLGPRVFFSKHTKAGGRIPAIDKKLMALQFHAKPLDKVPYLHMLPIDTAIEMLGNYNPIYSSRPKELPMWLLESAAAPARLNKTQMTRTGLIYYVPMQTGVRSTRRITSAAGLALLDHWAEKFPAFKPFVNAFVNDAMRERITCDCFDMSLGVTPKWIADDIKADAARVTKWEAREYRRIKKEEAIKEKMAEDRRRQEAQLQQWAMQQANQQAEYQRMIAIQNQKPHLWGSGAMYTAGSPSLGSGIVGKRADTIIADDVQGVYDSTGWTGK